MEWYISFLSRVVKYKYVDLKALVPSNNTWNDSLSVIESLVQVCLPKNIGQNGMKH
jgi:hypothetical protein